VTFLILAQHGMVGPMYSEVDTTYLADTVILLRYFEALGEVRQALSVVKKRTGKHERTIRELRFDGGIRLGEPLREFQGVLTGVPTIRGFAGPLARPTND
jgi:circadian clock protein KaiC